MFIKIDQFLRLVILQQLQYFMVTLSFEGVGALEMTRQWLQMLSTLHLRVAALGAAEQLLSVLGLLLFMLVVVESEEHVLVPPFLVSTVLLFATSSV